MTMTLFDDTDDGFADLWPAPPSARLRRVIVERVVHVARHKDITSTHASVPARPVVYVGRTFAGRTDIGFGNPLDLDTDTPTSRALLLGAYHRWLTSVDPAARRVMARITAGDLDHHTIGCWCSPRLCHGMILAGLAAGYDDDVADWAEALTAAASY